MTKRCPRCGVTKEASEFPKAGGRADGLASTCKVCKHVVDGDYYRRNPEGFQKRNARSKEDRRRTLVQYLSEHPCVDCGETDILVLEFDHIEEKAHNVSTMLVTRVSWARVLEEIAKCKVRCANCHTRITRQRANDWRWRLAMPAGVTGSTSGPEPGSF